MRGIEQAGLERQLGIAHIRFKAKHPRLRHGLLNALACRCQTLGVGIHQKHRCALLTKHMRGRRTDAAAAAAWLRPALTAALIEPCRRAGLGYALFSARRSSVPPSR